MWFWKKSEVSILLDEIKDKILVGNISDTQGPFSCRHSSDSYQCIVDGEKVVMDKNHSCYDNTYEMYFRGTKIDDNQYKLRKIHNLIRKYKLFN